MASENYTTKKPSLQDFKNRNYPHIKDAILENITIDIGTQCWNWTSGIDAYGYGSIRISGKAFKAHRLSYVLLSKPHEITEIPSEMCICHRCDNRRCVNPDHLWVGTKSENTIDMLNKGRNIIGELAGNAIAANGIVLEIREKYATGEFTIAMLSDEYGMSLKGVHSIIIGTTWAHIGGPIHVTTKNNGEINKQSKLKESDIIEIRKLLRIGMMSHSEIGEMFSVGKSQISRISTGARWGWFDGGRT